MVGRASSISRTGAMSKQILNKRIRRDMLTAIGILGGLFLVMALLSLIG